MSCGEVGTPSIDCVVDLAAQILIVLPGDLRYRMFGVTFTGASVAGLAQARVHTCSVLDQLAVTESAFRTRIELTHETRHIGNGLWAREVMLVSEVLHARVPAAPVAEVDELLREHGKMLSADTRNIAIPSAAAGRSVTGRTDLEELRSAIQIGLFVQGLGPFLLRRRQGQGGSTGQQPKSHASQRQEQCSFHECLIRSSRLTEAYVASDGSESALVPIRIPTYEQVRIASARLLEQDVAKTRLLRPRVNGKPG